MNSANLSVVFGPSLVYVHTGNQAGSTIVSSATQIIKLLLDNFNVVFGSGDEASLPSEPLPLFPFSSTILTSHAIEADPDANPNDLAISLRDVVKQGIMSKKGGISRHNWKVRWFILKKFYLYYFATPKVLSTKIQCG